METINILEKNKCCGCTACYSICPTQAIKMELDTEGFRYPIIDESKCIKCGKCVSVCPGLRENIQKESEHCYAAKVREDDIRKNSSSGGVFSKLATFVEEHDGVIYGAAFNENFEVIHQRAENEKEWCKFKKSKYVQSDLNDTFLKVKQDLEQKRYVLFTGTPCQVAGLKAYLEKCNTELLITCDIVCHGVPSPGIWKEYIGYIENVYQKEVSQIDFRNKEIGGWHNSSLAFFAKNNEMIFAKKHNENMFSKLFFSHYIMRTSCYQCQYSNYKRLGDITLGDYWGIEKVYPEFDDNKGVSLVLINSEKGYRIWKEVCQNVNYIEVTKEECQQPNLVKASFRPFNRELFWKAYHKRGWLYAGMRVGIFEAKGLDKIFVFVDKVVNKLQKIFQS